MSFSYCIYFLFCHIYYPFLRISKNLSPYFFSLCSPTPDTSNISSRVAGRITHIPASVLSANTIYGGTFSSDAISRLSSRKLSNNSASFSESSAATAPFLRLFFFSFDSDFFSDSSFGSFMISGSSVFINAFPSGVRQITGYCSPFSSTYSRNCNSLNICRNLGTVRSLNTAYSGFLSRFLPRIF